MNRIFKMCVLLISLLSVNLMGQAQGATPQYIVDAAIRTAKADLPSLGDATGWSHQIVNGVTTTALGCVLVQGVTLPAPIDVYRVVLTFGDSDYRVHVSADATMVQLCDERFPGMVKGVSGTNSTAPDGDTDGDGIKNSDDLCPLIAGVESAPQKGCPAVTDEDRDGDGVANSVDFCPDQAGSSESDGCPLLTDSDSDGIPDVDDICVGDAGVIQADFARGCPLDGSGTSSRVRLATDICRVVLSGDVQLLDNPASNASPIGTLTSGQAEGNAGVIIGRTANTDYYQVGGGWIRAGNVRLSGACYNLPVGNISVGSGTGCFLRPNGTFANVRNGPTTNDTQVATIYPNQNYSVLGKDGTGEWFFFNQGWVHQTVIELSGDCNNVPTLNPQFVGSGSVFFCPPEFTSYLPPRISLGTANARVSASNVPNRLREEPTVDSEQIGEIQPGRTINAVIDGPACNEGYVWWKVNIDGTIGWTVESDITGNAYYLEPLDDAGNTVDANTPPTAVPQAPPPSTQANPTTFQVISSSNAGQVDTLLALPVELPMAVAFSPVNSVLAIVTTQEIITFHSYPSFEDITDDFNLPDDLRPSAVAFSAGDRYVAIGNEDGRIYVAAMNESGAVAGNYLPNSHTSPVRGLEWSHEGNILASISGLNDQGALAEWTLKTRDLTGYTSGADFAIGINFAYPYPLSDVAFSADDQYVAVTGESPSDLQAALWIYQTSDAGQVFSKGLVYMEGFTFVTGTPDVALGDFIYGNGDKAYRYSIESETDEAIYTDSGMYIGQVAFRPQVIEGAEALMAVTNGTPGGFTGEETLVFLNALNTASPSGTLTVSSSDVAFSPDGRVLAVVDGGGNQVFMLGVTDG